jgi:hypothetical protein
MRKFHTAKEMLKSAEQAGFIIKVYGEPTFEPDYQGNSAAAAWDAVEATEEAQVTFHNADGSRIPGSWAVMMADGPGTCEPQETVVDCAASGWANDWWETNRDAILA